jgi:hypothetical protein
MRTLRLLLFGAAVGCGLSSGCSSSRRGELKDEFYQDFRTKLPPASVLALAPNTGEEKVIRREPQGLRILVAGKPSGFPPFGASPRFGVIGDFEITVSYELLKLEKPKGGYGTGVSLWVMGKTDAVTLARFTRKDSNVFATNKGWMKGSDYANDTQSAPTDCKSGKLRLARAGTVVRCLVAEGDSDEFRELRAIDFNKDDLTQVHVGVDTGGDTGPVEVLLTDLRVRAEELPLSGVPKKQTWGSWLLWALAGVAGAAAIAVSAFLVWRSRARKKSAEEGPEEPAPRAHRPKA